jgi:hypothetical protein
MIFFFLGSFGGTHSVFGLGLVTLWGRKGEEEDERTDDPLLLSFLFFLGLLLLFPALL